MNGSSSQSPAADFSQPSGAAAPSLEGDSVEAILARASAMSTGTYVAPTTFSAPTTSIEGDSIEAILARAAAMSTGTYVAPTAAAQSAGVLGKKERATATVLRKMNAYADKQSQAFTPASRAQALEPVRREKLFKLSALTAMFLTSQPKKRVGIFFKRTFVLAIVLGVSFGPVFVQPWLQSSKVAARLFSAVIGTAFLVHCFVAFRDSKNSSRRK